MGLWLIESSKPLEAGVMYSKCRVIFATRSESDTLKSGKMSVFDVKTSKRPRMRRLIKYMVVLGILVIFSTLYYTNADDAVIKMTDEELVRYRSVKLIKEVNMSERDLSTTVDSVFQIGCREIDFSQPRANASLVMLARNKEIDDVIKSMISMERHFNQWFNYPWVFLNDEPFDETFQNTVKQYTKSLVEFGTIPKEQWEFPEDIDKDEFNEFTNYQGDRRILYGNNPSYHKMCRFFSNSFFQHPLVKKREWYWRVEPNVEFFCDLTYDPFVEMEKHGKKYGFNVAIHELYYTVPGLFRETKAFVKEKNIQPTKLWRMFIKNFKYSEGKNDAKYDMLKSPLDILKQIEYEVTTNKLFSMKPKSGDDVDPDLLGKMIVQASEKPILHLDRFDYEEYNLCHFWSNFEIAKTEIFTSPLYQEYFQRLDQSGGFYKERWGDAPVHSLAVALMLDVDDIHYFRDIGYKHSTIGHCPANSKIDQLPYQPSDDNVNNKNFRSYKPDKGGINGVGCRCKCPLWHEEIEDQSPTCIRQWFRVTKDTYQPNPPVNIDFYRAKIERRLNKFLKRGGKLGENRIAEDLIR